MIRLSVTRAKTFQTCQASWYMENVLGYQVPQTPALTLGSDVHAVLEAYLKGELTIEQIAEKAVELKPYTIAHRGLYHLDSIVPKGKARVEEWVRDSVKGLPFTGKIDAWWIEGTTLHILDHKTTSDARKYALSPEDAYHDLQLRVYAYQVAKGKKGLKRVVGHLIYYPTKRGVALGVNTEPWGPRDLLDTWTSFERIADDMLEVARTGKPERNPSACSAYGGCPFLQECKRFSIEGFPKAAGGVPRTQGAEMIEHAIEALKPFPNPTDEQIEQAAKRAKVAVEEVKKAIGVETLSPSIKAKVEDMRARILSWMDRTGSNPTDKSIQRAAQEVGVTAETLVDGTGLLQIGEEWALKAEPTIAEELPPEPTIEEPTPEPARLSPLPPLPPEPVIAPEPEPTTKVTPPSESLEPLSYSTEAVIEAQEDLLTALEKALYKSNEALAQEVHTLRKEIDRLEDERVALVNKAPQSKPYLCVDCIPQGIPSIPLIEYLTPYLDKVAQRAGVSDVALIDYGKGWAEAAAYLQSDIRKGQSPFPADVILTDSKDSPYWKHFERYLTPLFIVIRGV